MTKSHCVVNFATTGQNVVVVVVVFSFSRQLTNLINYSF